MDWLKQEIEKRQQSGDFNNFVKPNVGDNEYIIDLSEMPAKREINKDGKKLLYFDFKLLDDKNNGKVLSCTPYLYDVIMDELAPYKDKEVVMAHLIIKVKKTSESTEYSVFVREVT